MAKTDFKTIDEYVATFPKDIQLRLEECRKIIHETVPEAIETISYQIPCFNLNGPILYFCAFKNHISISAPPPTMENFKDELKNYKTSISVFQVPHSQPIPKDLIVKMAKWRLELNTKK